MCGCGSFTRAATRNSTEQTKYWIITNRDMWKAVGEVFECCQNLLAGFCCFEIFGAGAVAFLDTLQCGCDGNASETTIAKMCDVNGTMRCLPLFWSPMWLCSILFHAKPCIAAWSLLWHDALLRSGHLYRSVSFFRTYLCAISASPWPSTVLLPDTFAHQFYSPWRTADRNRWADLQVADTLDVWMSMERIANVTSRCLNYTQFIGHLHSPSSLVTWPLYSGTNGRSTSFIKTYIWLRMVKNVINVLKFVVRWRQCAMWRVWAISTYQKA